MEMRKQISLKFDDVDLFHNLVAPYAEGRVLNSLIIKCLSAYYYNEEVKSLIEGTSIEDDLNEDNCDERNLCDNIRTSLLSAQDILISELQNTINNGTEDVENILRQTNDFAKESGVVKSTTSECDLGSVLIEQQSQQVQQVQTDETPQEYSLEELQSISEDLDKDVNTVRQYMENILKGFNSYQSGVVKLIDCIKYLEAKKAKLEAEYKKLEADNKVSHHAPFDTAAIFSEQSLAKFRTSVQGMLIELDKTLDSKIPMEGDLV